MTIFTESQAKEKLDDVLEKATSQGEVWIRRSDGRQFLVKPLPTAAEPTTTNPPRRYRDLSDIAGTALPDPGFEQALLDQDQIDPDMWK